MSRVFPTLHPQQQQQQSEQPPESPTQQHLYPPPSYPPPAHPAHLTTTHTSSCLRPSHPTPSLVPPSPTTPQRQHHHHHGGQHQHLDQPAPSRLAPWPRHKDQQQQQAEASSSSITTPAPSSSSAFPPQSPYSRPRLVEADSQPGPLPPALLSHGPSHHPPIDHHPHPVVAPSSHYWSSASSSQQHQQQPQQQQPQQQQRDHSSGTLVPPRRVQHRPPPLHLVASHTATSYPHPPRTAEYLSPSRYTFYPTPDTYPSPSPQQPSDGASPLQSQQNASLHQAHGGNHTFPHPNISPTTTTLSASPTEHTHWGAQPDHLANLYPPGQIPIGAAAPAPTSEETVTVQPPTTTEADTLSSATGQPTGAEATHAAGAADQTAADAHAQAALSQSPVHAAAAAAWANPTMPYNYSVPGQVDYLAGDYTNINGVIPQLQAEHYVAGTADDYNQVTLSNWAEANPADPNGGVPSLVTDDANGGQVVIPEHHAAQALSVTGNGDGEKPKKLVLACHFCRGRKLKCDGGRPTCTHCAKRQLVCTYDEQVRRRGPGKRTKEMRERAAREAEAAGLGLNPESLAHLTGEPGPSSLMEAPKKAGRKRKSEAVDEAEKKARMEQEHAEAQAAVQAAAQAHAAAQLSAHVGLEHSLGEHDQPLIDPALAGEGGAVLDLPPLEPGTLGQVIQQLNGAQQ